VPKYSFLTSWQTQDIHKFDVAALLVYLSLQNPKHKMVNFREQANFIWSVADLLRGDYKQADYGKVILPLTILRRLDSLLVPTKQDVLKQWPKINDNNDDVIDLALNRITKYKFNNRSNYDFVKLAADADHIAANMRAYISGFSAGVRDIMEQFNFEDQIERLDKADLLYLIVKCFSEIDLANIDSLSMGYIFEELIRKFAEISNETAGEHFTPREVIELMVNLLFMDEQEIYKKGVIRTLYDPTAGTGGMLSVGEAYINRQNPDAELKVFGQEINPESYAICKADMLIKGQEPTNIKFGDTLREDKHEGERFNYMLANPPFGVDWKKAEKIVKAEYEKKGFAGRFGAGLPRINDGSLLFLLHMISKMQPADKGGSRLGIVLNGSPLFTGGAGSGESDIRRWIIENDMLESIIALPDQLFYNTGISTYIWIVTNHKDKKRKGKIQLINATSFFVKMPRSLGNKRNEIAGAQIKEITKLYGAFKESEQVKIFPNEFFGYSRITVERPLVSEKVKEVKEVKEGKKGKAAKSEKVKAIKGKNGEQKADSSLRDFENIPLQEDIEAYFKREVLPHVPDAWIDHSKTKVGYEVNFTKYFYEYKPLRPLADIRRDILALEQETEGLIKEIID
jgi:type I restriction enzyme M protein